MPFQAEGKFRKYVTDTLDNRLRIATLYLMLADDFSRSVLDGLLLFRLTLDSTIVGKIASPYREEFFAEDVLSFAAGEVFVDGGAFDGDSHQRFAEMAPQFARAYLFEPDAAICQRAEQRVASDPRVSVCNFGLWSRTGELRFSSTGGMDGAICDDGDIRIQVVAIDEFVHDKVTHIKLDVEGAEEEALLGARRQISHSRPKMAVALYHRAVDLWKIPVLIETLGGQYQYSIRHYSQTMDDSIVYAIPIN
jgi:FkbM family methyltransferase